jgi:hypothetical protein
VPITHKQYLSQLQLAVDCRRNGRYLWADTICIELLTAGRGNESSLYHTIGQISTDTGRFTKALHAHAIAVELRKAHGTIDTPAEMAAFQPMALGLAQSLMRFGRFEEAWPYWEAGRLNVAWAPWPGCKYLAPEDSPDSVLVQSEGGYGDTFMMMRWLPLLKDRRGAKRVGLMLWEPLVNFCDWSRLGVDQVYRIGIDKITFGEWQYATSIMSLPAVFGMKTWEEIPPPTPTINALFGPSGMPHPFRIAFAWRAEENSSPIRTKSLPLDVASQIIEGICHKDRREDVQMFSLSPEKKDLYSDSSFEQPPYLTYEPERMKDWRATAEYLCGMDFVLTVDSAVAHLAGLLGVPTLVLLPASSCWRWGDPNGDAAAYSAWYGPQLTLYRQPEPLKWDASAIVAALKERLK